MFISMQNQFLHDVDAFINFYRLFFREISTLFSFRRLAFGRWPFAVGGWQAQRGEKSKEKNKKNEEYKL